MIGKWHGMTNGEAMERLNHSLKHGANNHGLTNGAVMEKGNHAHGMTNGMAQSAGFTNGASMEAYKKGYTNGNASGYASGFTNGISQEGGNLTIVPLKRSSKHSKRYQALIAICLIFATISAPFLTSFMVNKVPIMIDGIFKDWAEVDTYYGDIGDMKNKNIDIAEYKRFDYSGDTYIYLKTLDSLLKGNGAKHDRVMLLVDTDGYRETGYQANGLGYDMMVVISGYDNKVIKNNAYSYEGYGNDWADWKVVGKSVVAMKDNEIEFKLRSIDPTRIVVDAYIQSADGELEQIDVLLTAEYRGYRVYQSVVSDRMVGVGDTPATSISMVCDANTTHITSIKFTMLGTASDSSFGRFRLLDENNSEVGGGFINSGLLSIDTDITLVENDMKNYTLHANILENETGDTFLFNVESGYDFSSQIIPKVYDIYKNFSYIGYEPTDVRIDGGFAEWNLDYIPDVGGDAENTDRLDVIRSDSKYEETKYSMAMRYFNRACEGEIMPYIPDVGNGSGGGGDVGNTTDTNITMCPDDPLTGEDILIISIGSDRRVEIRGKEGKITKSVFAVFNGTNWTETGSIESYCDERNVEFSIKNVTVSENDIIRVISSNWNNETHFYNHTHVTSVLEYGIMSDPTLPIPLGTISHLQAYQQNTTLSVTLDGDINGKVWATRRTCDYVIDLTRDFKVFTQRSATYLYIALFSLADSTIQSEDIASVYFDTWNAGGSTPNNASYKQLGISGTTVTYYQGSGTGWASTTTPTGWAVGKLSTDYGGTEYRSYEFQIPISDLDANGKFGATDEEIGVGIQLRDYKTEGGSHNYWLWYPDNYYSGTPTTQYTDKPDTWGDMIYKNDWTAKSFVETVDTTSATITINGNLNENAWTTDATTHNIITLDNSACADYYFMRDSTYVYIGIVLDGQTSAISTEFASVYFDTDYSQTASPDAGDKYFGVDYANATLYYEGTGTGWTTATLPTGWTAKIGRTGLNVSFEFRVTLVELDEGGKFGAEGEVIGFGSLAYKPNANLNTRVLFFFPDNVQKYIPIVDMRYFPSYWGELMYAVPEGNVITMVITIMLIIPTTIYYHRKRCGNHD